MATFSTSENNKVSIVERDSKSLPQSGSDSLFKVKGRIIVTFLIGEVTDVIETQANATKLVVNPTIGANVDLCSTYNISANSVGTMYNLTGTLADALVATVSGAMIGQASSIIITDGTIDLDCVASNSGAVKWTLHYIPLDNGSNVLSV
jgi:hypothetical protein